MKIQYCSDLHLEFGENMNYIMNHPLDVNGDILILAGDITTLSHIEGADRFIDFASKNFEHTYWIAGNHEYYGYDIATKGNVFKERIRDNVTLLNNQIIEHGNVKLIFSTLWSKISQQNRMVYTKESK